jgi:hypothetical protein
MGYIGWSIGDPYGKERYQGGYQIQPRMRGFGENTKATCQQCNNDLEGNQADGCSNL